jgi:hypothetical protein
MTLTVGGVTASDANVLSLRLSLKIGTAWQTKTPNASNAVPTVIDYALGGCIHLGSPADNTQLVSAPTNVPDGQSFTIHLAGGGASGSWPQWASGSPTVDGWVFIGGAAPTAPLDAADSLPIYCYRDGYKFIAAVSTNTVPA